MYIFMVWIATYWGKLQYYVTNSWYELPHFWEISILCYKYMVWIGGNWSIMKLYWCNQNFIDVAAVIHEYYVTYSWYELKHVVSNFNIMLQIYGMNWHMLSLISILCYKSMVWIGTCCGKLKYYVTYSWYELTNVLANFNIMLQIHGMNWHIFWQTLI